jgi:zinc protease
MITFTLSKKNENYLMIQFEEFTLENGLQVVVHIDNSTPMAVVNVLYDVGAKDEHEAQTGFAHLFEHLMFGGSINIPEYDTPLQMAGGENNAYTTNDITNYYCSLPAENLETAFWLESDRMLSLAFSEKSLDVQRKVVCEEFKEHYINKPYGDVWHKLRALAYTTHPYKWMTIGKELKHIEDATLQDVKNFFFKHYRPKNAILSVAGNITVAEVKRLAEKWFGTIEAGEKYIRNLPTEPMQLEARKLEVAAAVPANAFYKAWHICDRLDKKYYATDLITELLSGGASSRLYNALVKEQKLFTKISCYHTGNTDKGLCIVSGMLSANVAFENAEAAVDAVIMQLINTPIHNDELQKVKNKTESMLAFEDMGLMNRANNLAFYKLLGDANLINKEGDNYNAVTIDDIVATAKEIFKKENSNVLYYKSTINN